MITGGTRNTFLSWVVSKEQEARPALGRRTPRSWRNWVPPLIRACHTPWGGRTMPEDCGPISKNTSSPFQPMTKGLRLPGMAAPAVSRLAGPGAGPSGNQ